MTPYTQSAELRSKHGIILSCSMTCSENVEEAIKEHLALLVLKLEGQKYGFVDDSISLLVDGDARAAAVWNWLKTEMDTS